MKYLVGVVDGESAGKFGTLRFGGRELGKSLSLIGLARIAEGHATTIILDHGGFRFLLYVQFIVHVKELFMFSGLFKILEPS